MEEKWKQINGYDNYEVSDKGNVRNKTTKKILRKAYYASGYALVALRIDKKTKTYGVQKLVYDTFIGPYDTKKYAIIHKDGDKTNNSVENLELGDKNIVKLIDFKPTELKLLESLICNNIKITLSKWYSERDKPQIEVR